MNKIMERINKNKNTIIITTIILVLIMGIFYWFELRPSNIKKGCAIWAIDKAINQYGNYGDSKKYQPAVYDDYFERCLREKGL